MRSDPAGRSGSVRVSALVVNYHAYDELDACLHSLRHQRERVETIVVDHDTDPIRREPLQARFPEVLWLPCEDNPGFAAGVNRAARRSAGAYLYLVNPDAVVSPETAGALADWLDGQPSVAVIGSRVLDPDGTVQGSARRFPGVSTAFAGRTTWLTRVFPSNALTRRNVLTGPDVQNPVDVDWVSGASMMIRRTAFDAIGGMDEAFFLYWEDADLCRRLHTRGWRTIYHPGVSVTHLCGRSSRVASTRSMVAFHRSAYRYVKKHATGLARCTVPLAYVGLGVRLGLKLLAARMAPRSQGGHT